MVVDKCAAQRRVKIAEKSSWAGVWQAVINAGRAQVALSKRRVVGSRYYIGSRLLKLLRKGGALSVGRSGWLDVRGRSLDHGAGDDGSSQVVWAGNIHYLRLWAVGELYCERPNIFLISSLSIITLLCYIPLFSVC